MDDIPQHEEWVLVMSILGMFGMIGLVLLIYAALLLAVRELDRPWKK